MKVMKTAKTVLRRIDGRVTGKIKEAKEKSSRYELDLNKFIESLKNNTLPKTKEWFIKTYWMYIQLFHTLLKSEDNYQELLKKLDKDGQAKFGIYFAVAVLSLGGLAPLLTIFGLPGIVSGFLALEVEEKVIDFLEKQSRSNVTLKKFFLWLGITVLKILRTTGSAKILKFSEERILDFLKDRVEIQIQKNPKIQEELEKVVKEIKKLFIDDDDNPPPPVDTVDTSVEGITPSIWSWLFAESSEQNPFYYEQGKKTMKNFESTLRKAILLELRQLQTREAIVQNVTQGTGRLIKRLFRFFGNIKANNVKNMTKEVFWAELTIIKAAAQQEETSLNQMLQELGEDGLAKLGIHVIVALAASATNFIPGWRNLYAIIRKPLVAGTEVLLKTKLIELSQKNPKFKNILGMVGKLTLETCFNLGLGRLSGEIEKVVANAVGSLPPQVRVALEEFLKPFFGKDDDGTSGGTSPVPVVSQTPSSARTPSSGRVLPSFASALAEAKKPSKPKR